MKTPPIGSAPTLNQQDFVRLFTQAQSHHRSGELGLAESVYRQLVRHLPHHRDLWHLLGVVALQQGQAAKAARQFREALEIDPEHAESWNNLGLAHKANDRLQEAEEALRRALDLRPDYANAAFNLGLVLEMARRPADAEAAYREVLRLDPTRQDAATNLANLLRSVGRPAEALPLLERIVQSDPGADAIGNLALALVDVHRPAEARQVALEAVRRSASDPRWVEVAAIAARLAGDPDTACDELLPQVDQGRATETGAFEAAQAAEAVGDADGARRSYAAALRLAPAWERLAWSDALSLPAFVDSNEQAQAQRARFTDGVDRLARGLAERRGRLSGEDRASLVDASASVSAFGLSYLPLDTFGAQCAFGDLIAAAVRRALPDLPALEARPRQGRIRVGIVSAYLGRHVVSRFFAELLCSLDPADFEVHAWMTGSDSPEWRELAGRFEHATLLAASPLDVIATMRDAALDVALFPDVLMDPRQQFIAAARVAPVQAALYGHPTTTGLASIDAFFSGDLLEPPGAEAHYRERLIRLPGLGAAPMPPRAPGSGEWLDAIRDGRPLALCLQTPTKLVPDFDAPLARVLAAADARLVIFDRSRRLTARYLQRIAPSLRAAGLDPERAVAVVPVRYGADYLAGIARADLVLDSPWFSGGSTSLDAIGLGVPTVAVRGPFARGRQTAAMLQLAGTPELVAEDLPSWEQLATRLLRDRDARAGLAERLKHGAAAVFDAQATQAAFADRLRELAGERA